jgi:heat shock protein HslJ
MIRNFLIPITVAALCAACSAPKPTPPSPESVARVAPPPSLGGAVPAAGATARSLDGSAWTLAWVPGFELPAQPPATLRFEGGRASGSDGCNRYTTTFTRNGSQLQFGAKAAATLMACPSEVMQVANAVGALLYETRSYRIENDTLTLVGADGKALANLKEQANRLAGTSWQVTAVNNGRQAVVSVLAGTSLTMVFGNDGKLSGSGGCNNFNATYQADGGMLRIDTPAATRMMCAQPEGRMAQEAQFLAALSSATQARREADRLELRTASGALAVSARLALP